VGRIGLAYTADFGSWIRSEPGCFDFLELRGAEFGTNGAHRFQRIAERNPVAIAGGQLSLGTPGHLHEDDLTWLAEAAALARPLWLSEPVGFRRTAEVELTGFCPVRPDQASLDVVAGHAREAVRRLGRPLLLENVATPLGIPGPMAESTFLDRVAAEAGCALLVDLAALVAQSRTHGFDAVAWLHDLAPERIAAVRVGAPVLHRGHWRSSGGSCVEEDMWAMAREALAHGRPRDAILAYDDKVPHPTQLGEELGQLRSLMNEIGIAG
jgi:uncharacterized protein (UPF0276 family)